jgi:hypothetical protein
LASGEELGSMELVICPYIIMAEANDKLSYNLVRM